MIIGLFLTVLLLHIKLAHGQFGFIRCSSGEPCTPLPNCQSLKDAINAGEVNVQSLHRRICGFQGRTSKVCCKPSTPKSILPKRCGISETQDRIIGGEQAPLGAYPWMVTLGYEEIGLRGIKYLCAGSLISERYVLTAAHCLDKAILGPRKLKVLNLGDWDLSTPIDCQRTALGNVCGQPHQVVGIEAEILHPDYDKRGSSSDDIALIRMDRAVAFSSEIQPICLPPKGLNPRAVADKREPVAAGWGLTENSTNSKILLRVTLPFNDDAACKSKYGNRWVGKQLCIGGKGGFDTCSGDSGAPLFLPGPEGPPYLQIGIVSFGFLPCGIAKNPAVYTSVSDYLDWIVNNVKP